MLREVPEDITGRKRLLGDSDLEVVGAVQKVKN